MKRTQMPGLVCPMCHSRLCLTVRHGDERAVSAGDLQCSACDRVFPVRDGVPQMFVPFDTEATPDAERFRISRSVVERWVEQHVPPAQREQEPPTTKLPPPRAFKVVRAGYLAGGLLLWAAAVILFVTALPGAAVTCAVSGLVIFAADYIWYRWREQRAYRRHLLVLRQGLRAPGRVAGQQHRVSQMKPFHESVPDRDAAGVRTDQLAAEERGNQLSLVRWKSFKVAETLHTLSIKGKRALNIGCGGRLHTPVSQPYFARGFEMVGLDFRQDHVLEFCEEFGTDGVLGNALCLPFAAATFDCVHCTDVIEHLYSPKQSLREIARVLRRDGVLLMTTENRTSFGFFASHPLACYALNPLVFLERVVGTVSSAVLPPREIVGSWGGLTFYHTQFSPRELKDLLRDAGLRTLRLETAFPVRKLEPLNQLLARVPCLRQMGYSLFAVARKERREAMAN